MPEVAIDAKGLGKCYRLYDRPGDRLREIFSPTRKAYHHEKWALRGLDLAVTKGECVGLLGRNGAGKSTTLKLLAGKLKPSAGTVSVKGRLSSILELGTGFQPHLTGRQNALVSGLFMGLAPWDTDRHVAKIIEFAEIGEYADQPLATYSSGMQARLGFATLTTLDPEVLILDEALATGDASFAAKCNDYLRSLCRSGCTTILASHDVRFLATTCDRIVWIEKGQQRASGSPGAIVQQYLDALEAHDDVTARPRFVLLRFESEDAAASFTVHSIEWADEQERVLGEHYVGDEATWLRLLDAAAFFGFTPVGARAGWGAAELTAGFNRACRPGAEGVYLTVPVPPAPHPVPSWLRVNLRHASPVDARISIQVDGRWTSLGTAGKRRAPAPESDKGWHPSEWGRVPFDVARLFRRDETRAGMLAKERS